MSIDYNKSGVLGAGQVQAFTGINIDYDDTATNNAAAIGIVTGAQISLTNDSDQGVMAQTGLNIWCTGSDAASTSGIIIRTPNNASDLRVVSQDGVSDIFTIDTKDDGETTLTTFESGGGSTAHMNLVADGNIVLDSADDIEINADGGDINFKDNTLTLAKINAAEGIFLSQAGTSNSQITFETTTENAILQAPADSAAERTITLPDATGTVALTSDVSGGTPFNIRYSGSTKNLANTNYMTGFTNYSFATNYNNAIAPTSLDHSDLMAAVFIAPRAGRISNVKIQGSDASGAGYNDPFKFYFFKGAMVSNATTASLALMDSTTSITPSTSGRTWVHTEDWSSGMDFAEDDMLFIFFKKDSSGSAQTVSFNMNLNGYLT